MKKNVLLFIFIMIVGCTSETKVYSKNEVENKDKLWYEKKSGKLVSGFIEMSVTNKIISKCQYEDGKRNGLELIYDKTTKNIISKTNFKNGLREKESFFYFPDGTLQFKSVYCKGKLCGEEISYYPNGKIMSIVQYKDGIQYGKEKLYDMNGNLL